MATRTAAARAGIPRQPERRSQYRRSAGRRLRIRARRQQRHGLPANSAPATSPPRSNFLHAVRFHFRRAEAHRAGRASFRDAEVEALIAERTAAKKAKNFARRRSDPPAASGPGHHPGRHQVRRSLEEEIEACRFKPKRSMRATAKSPAPTSPHHPDPYRLQLFLRFHGAARPRLRRRGSRATATRATTIPRRPRSKNWWPSLESGHGALACASGMAAIHMAILTRARRTGASRSSRPMRSTAPPSAC